MKKAFYLSGGGARGAYQAGVLKGISDIIKTKNLPVQILSSVSAGSINAAMLAMHADNFSLATERLVALWSSLKSDKIFRTNNFSLAYSVMRNIVSMLFHYKTESGGFLLDTTPLQGFLDANLDFNKINQNIDRGLLTDFEVATTCYDSSETISFFKSQFAHPTWRRVRHISCPTEIRCQHILASAALPLFFPSIRIEGLHFGDGGLRLAAPLRASIQFDASSILIIGTHKVNKGKPLADVNRMKLITFGKILGSMLNALFMDKLDRDLELLNKVNETVKNFPPEVESTSKWKPIQTLYISPSKDLGKIAGQKQRILPLLLHYLMTMFGTKEQSGDYLSYLLFEYVYSKDLIEIGYNDAFAKKEQIQEFFSV
jgi:NTE family protein